jgi:CRISPR-associated protein Cas6
MHEMNHLELHFPVRGTTIPLDHGYALYGAISRVLPELHGADWLNVCGIGAKVGGPGVLSLHRPGTLRLRIPTDKIPVVIGLAGKQLDIAGRHVVLGAPTVAPLLPAAALDARAVYIRLTNGAKGEADKFAPEDFAARFLAEAKRQVAKLSISCTLELRGRQEIRVAGKRLIGNSVLATGLSDEDSLKLQIAGIGGKRTMGCGVFRAARAR